MRIPTIISSCTQYNHDIMMSAQEQNVSSRFSKHEQKKVPFASYNAHPTILLISFIFNFFCRLLGSKIKYVNSLDGLPRNLIFMALLALTFIWWHLAINRPLALSHTGNTQHPQSFLWGAREPETVAGHCPMWMMAKIKRTCIHTSYTHLLSS